MGIIKNIFKGIGKVFKKIGKGIKKAFKAFGKFMGKIGFVGQLAMMFLFPAGIGSMFLKGLGKLGATLASATGNSIFSAAARGIGNVLTKAKNFVTAAKSGFSSITNGIKEFGKTALNKFGEATGLFKIDSAAQNFFGVNSAMERTAAGFGETKKLFRGLKDGTFNLEEAIDLDKLSNKVGISAKDLKSLNPDMKIINGVVQPMESLNLDLAEGLKIDFEYQSQANIQNVLARGTSPASMGQSEVFAADGFENYVDQQKSYGNVTKGNIQGPQYADNAMRMSGSEYSRQVRAGLQEQGVEAVVNEVNPQTVLENTSKAPISVSETDKIVNQAIQAPEKILPTAKDKNWLQKSVSRTAAPFDPTQVGFIQAGKNAMQVASEFGGQEEIDYGTRSFGIVDAFPQFDPMQMQATPSQFDLAYQTPMGTQNNMFGIGSFMDFTRSNPGFYDPLLGFYSDQGQQRALT
jgi:hypothetical protein